MTDAATTDLIVAHSSDLHIGARYHRDGELHTLRAVLSATADADAKVLILAGDVFDSHRIGDPLLEEVAACFAAAPFETVILPGNHDPATDDAVHRRGPLSGIANLHILGVTVDGHVLLPELDLEVSGIAHDAYADMAPITDAHVRGARWHVVVAHGHWYKGPQDAHRGWLIRDQDITSTGADYVALGHWDLPQPAGDGTIPAYYSGSPELARTINVVSLSDTGTRVERAPLDLG